MQLTNIILSTGYKNRKGVLNMQKYTFCMTGMLAFLLTFGSMLMGCDTSTGGTGFVPVTDISNIPQIALQGIELELNGVVLPSNATNQAIIWSGDDVTNGNFTGTTTGNHTVTATIANGTSESSPYTKTFTITVYDNNATANQIALAQGSWTKASSTGATGLEGTDTFTVSKSSWTLTNDTIGNAVYAKGIVIQADGTNYIAQINATLRSDGQLHPDYFYDTGTYIFTDTNSKVTMTSNNPSYMDPMSGTWTKKP
jgi:hypothetical protein